MTAIDLATYDFVFRPRGIGNNWLPCFICGHKRVERCQGDLAAFIDHSQAHVMGGENPLRDEKGKVFVTHPLSTFFFENDVVATLDYREYEPHRVQMKLGACGEHLPNLDLLCELTAKDGTINKHMLQRVIPGRKLP